MARSRHHHHSSGSSSSSHSSSSTYNSYLRYYYVWIVFEFLTLISLLGFLGWTFVVRRMRTDSSKPLPMKAFLGSIISFIGVRITNIISILLVLCNAKVTLGVIALPIINLIFYLIAFLLGLFVFWHMIHKLLEWVAGRENTRKLRITHWVFLVIFWILVLADYGVVIASSVIYTRYSYAMIPAAIMTATGGLITAVVSILFFVASIEIVGWTIYIFTKTDSESKSSVSSFGSAVLFFFIALCTYFIIQVTYYLSLVPAPDYLSAAQSIVEFICTVGVYFGLLTAFKNLYKSGIMSESKDIEDGETPQEDAGSEPAGRYARERKRGD